MREGLRICAVGIALASGLWGCSVGPNYEEPPLVLPSTFKQDKGAKADKPVPSIGELPWQSVFQDKVLQELIAEALTANKTLEAATARVEQFQAAADLQNSALYPQVGLGGSTGMTGVGGGPSRTQRGGIGSYGGGLQMSWEIDMWGRLRRLNESARARLMQQEEFRQAVRVSLIGSVAQTYYLLIGLDRQLVLADETIVSREAALRIAEARRQGGVISALDLQRFIADVADARNQRAAIARAVVQTQNQLSVLLGKNPTNIPRGVALIRQRELRNIPAGIPSVLLRRRPDILAAEQRMIAANAEIGAAIAEQFPQVAVSANLGVSSPQLLQTVAGLLSINQYIFDGGARSAQVRLQRGALKEAFAEYQQAVLVAFQEVENALIAHSTFREQIVQLTKQTESLGRALELAQARYEAGQASYLEVVNAQQEFFGAQLGLANAQAQRLIAYTQLYQALGGGWEDPSVPSLTAPQEPETPPPSRSVKPGGVRRQAP
jgi:multidrug efflux system outer membrane protein